MSSIPIPLRFTILIITSYIPNAQIMAVDLNQIQPAL